VREYNVKVYRLASGDADRREFFYNGLEPLVGSTITVTRMPAVAYPSKSDDELVARVDRIEGRRIHASEVRPLQLVPRPALS
jgi:hypothetical protein